MLWAWIKEAYAEWNADNALRLGAALSYYTIFAIAPLLVLTIAAAGVLFGRAAAQAAILDQITAVAGAPVAAAVHSMLNPQQQASGILATLVSVVTLLYGASGAFVELQDAMNIIWDAGTPPTGIWALLRSRLLSFAMVLTIGFLLLVSLILSAVLAGFAEYFTGRLPGALSGWMLAGLHSLLSLGVITVLFALIFKVLPDVDTAWRDVWVGAGITAILFTVGKFALGVYLGREGVTSSYGAAASFILVLLWVYYSTEILFSAQNCPKSTRAASDRRRTRLITPRPAARPDN